MNAIVWTSRVAHERGADVAFAREQRDRRRRNAPARSACDEPQRAAGDCSAGLSTTALPVASAAAVIPHGIASGKFQGEITAATPRGT